MPTDDRILRDQLLEFLRGGSAHLDFKTAVKDFPRNLYGKRPEGAPYSAWQLLEHIRFTLHDLLQFCTNSKYVAPDWPKDYWPEADAPPSNDAWDTSVRAVHEDIAEFEKLVGDPGSNLYAQIPWGDGQTLLREILLAGDHTSYHLGQLVMLRKQLGVDL
jgi:DinB superfamily